MGRSFTESPLIQLAEIYPDTDYQTPGTQFTCFTGTKVQMLTQRTQSSLCYQAGATRQARSSSSLRRCTTSAGTQLTCFTGTKVQILTQKEMYYLNRLQSISLGQGQVLLKYVYRNMYVCMYVYIYMLIYICMCMYMRVCVTCFASTKVQILTHARCAQGPVAEKYMFCHSFYLLYSYKNTNTDFLKKLRRGLLQRST